jgi:hypothetical protein
MAKRIFEAAVRHGQGATKNWWVRAVINGVMLVASLSFLIYAVYIGWDALQAHFRHLNFWLLGAALLLYPIGFLPSLWNWHAVMSRIGGCRDFRTNMRLYSLSCLPKRIPGAIWYISSRVVLYRECQVSYATTLVATAIETTFLALTGFLIYLLSLGTGLAELDYRLRDAIIAVLILALAVPLWAPLLRRGLRWLQVRTGALTPVEFGSSDALRLLGISGLGWIGGGLLLYILANSVAPLPPTQLPDLIGSWGAAGAVSLTAGLLIQGMGLREVTLAVLLSNYMPLSVAAVVSLLFRLLLTGGEFVWALVFAWLAPRLPK